MIDVEQPASVNALKARVASMRSQQRDPRSSRDEASGSQLVSLDVGGTVYTASRQTFSCVPDSWFAKVLSGDVNLPKTVQDVRFVDRDAQAFRYVLAHLRAVSTASSDGPPKAQLPAAADDLRILEEEAQFYRLPDLESSVRSALSAAAAAAAPSTSSPRPPTASGPITAAQANGVADDTTDIWNKASRMQLEFQSVYVTISSSNGLLFTEAERSNAMAEVNERTHALQASGFRVKAMNSGVAQDRKTKDYCMYFHAVLVRNTGKRVPAGGSGDSALPPRAVATEPGAVAASPATPKARVPAQQRTNGAAPAHAAASRGAEADQRHVGALDKLAKEPAQGGASDGSVPGGARATSRGASNRERSDEALTRTGGSASWQGPSLGRIPSQAESASGMARDSESFQNLHHSTHGRSAASQQVNTASTIDSMLAAGGQPTPPQPPGGQLQAAIKESDGAATEELAHAQAIANLGMPHVNDGAPRRHAEVRVYDINTEGPPRGIPQDWEEGLLEGRKRPANVSRPAEGAAPVVTAQPVLPSPARVGVPVGAPAEARPGVEIAAADREAGANKASVRLQAAQHAAEQSVEQAKKRAARAKMAGTPAAAASKGAAVDNELFVHSPTQSSRTHQRVSSSSVETDLRRPSRELSGHTDERPATTGGRESRIRGNAGPSTGPRDGGAGRNRLRSSLGRVLSGMKHGPKSLQAAPSSVATTPIGRDGS